MTGVLFFQKMFELGGADLDFRRSHVSKERVANRLRNWIGQHSNCSVCHEDDELKDIMLCDRCAVGCVTHNCSF